MTKSLLVVQLQQVDLQLSFQPILHRQSLITIIVGVWGEKCCLRPFDVSSSPSPIIAARFKASKISFYMFLSSPKLSLLS